MTEKKTAIRRTAVQKTTASLVVRGSHLRISQHYRIWGFKGGGRGAQLVPHYFERRQSVKQKIKAICLYIYKHIYMFMYI